MGVSLFLATWWVSAAVININIPSTGSLLMKPYRSWNPEQSHLLPPAPQDWLPDGHLVFFVIDVVRELDLSAITRAVDAKDARGAKPYSPVMMTTLLLYAYCVGVFSSRRIERATYEDVALRVLTAGEHPAYTVIAAFRRRHIEAFADIFRQTVAVCREAGMVKLGLVALDGTKMQGNASKHKAMSYERMQREEKRLEEEVKSLLRRAEDTDLAEDERFGEGQREEDLPAELRRREGRLEKIRAAKSALEEEARHARAELLEQRADRHEAKPAVETDPVERKRSATRARKAREEAAKLAEHFDDDEPPSGMRSTDTGLQTHRVKTTPDGNPAPKAQRNFTDPESRIQESGGSFLQGYNCQAVVDAETQVIVAQGVTNQPPDNHHLQPMLEQTAQTAGRLPDAAAADAGYWAPENAEYGEKRGVALYISTRRAHHGQPSPPSPDDDSPRSKMTRELATEAGRAIYARRKAIVEPVFGQLKEARGFRRFLLRGLRSVGGEWAMLAATHNLLKLFRHSMRPATT
jgi:transposase